MFFRVIILVILFSVCTGSEVFLVCGNYEKYNNSTHICVDNVAVPMDTEPQTLNLTQWMCGDPPDVKKYDKRIQTCINKTIVYLSAVATLPSTRCGLKNENRRKGCCGDAIYFPRAQTCCQSDFTQKFKIHNHKPEKTHVCCNLEAYGRRSARAVCHRSAYNDKFFQAKSRSKVNIKPNQQICIEYTHVYKIYIKRQTRKSLKAKVSEYLWRSSKSGEILRKAARKETDMRIKLDKYSPERNLSGTSFLVFSNHLDIQKKELRLRLREKVYLFPKHKGKQRQMLARIRWKCKRFRRRHG